jgi:hypothetical protein
MSVRAFSYGGGVQSTAALVLAAQGKLPATEDSYRWDAFLFANVGPNAEHPATLAYVEEYAKPYARDHGIDLRELRRRRRDGTPYDLYDQVIGSNRSIDIPIFVGPGAPGNRKCTSDYKVSVVARELRAMGAEDSDGRRAVVGIGISMDEMQRAKYWGIPDPRTPYQVKEYPLLRLRLGRRDAYQIISEAGLPKPPRSACWFCPFHTRTEWSHLKRDHPELFARAEQLEATILEKRAELGRDAAFLTPYMRPIGEVVVDQMELDLDEWVGDGAPCDSGHCFT